MEITLIIFASIVLQMTLVILALFVLHFALVGLSVSIVDKLTNGKCSKLLRELFKEEK